MLIKSILSTEPCVKVRVGMIVVVSEASYHGFDNNAICKVIEVNGNLLLGGRPFIVCEGMYLKQGIRPEHMRIASKSEKRIYHNQLKNLKCNANN